MQSFMQQSTGRVLAAAMVVLVTLIAGSVEAEKKTRSKLAKEARLIAFDTEAGTMTVKEKGKKVVYKVKFEGSVMTRTTSTINSRPVKLVEIPLKAKVNIYWIKDEEDPKRRFARKVDALQIPKEFLDDE